MAAGNGAQRSDRIDCSVRFRRGKVRSLHCVTLPAANTNPCLYWLKTHSELNQNGNYDLGSLALKDGIPKGEYRVYISAAVEAEDVTVSHVPGQAEYVMKSSGTIGGRILTPLIDPKYTDGKTSGITVNIDGSSKQFDFQVDRYQPKR